MKTKNDVILEVLNAQVLELIQKDIQTKKGYGDRFMKAASIVLAGGVKAIGGGKYDVKSGTQADVTYTVNGACDCEDAKNWLKKQKGEEVRSFAPEGRCKHRLAVTFEKTKETRLKYLVDNRYPHPHTWDCDDHRGEGVTCWQMQCPDPTLLPCPVCSALTVAQTREHEDQVEADRDRVDSIEIINPETGEITNETPFPEEEAPMMTTIGETIIGVVSSLNGHASCLGVPPGVALDDVGLPPLVPEQYEPAPVLAPRTQTLPEAGASLNIKLRMDQTEIMYTMRGHQDSEVLERLPEVLATLERILKIEVDHEEPFLKRLLHAFFPKPSKYTGK